MGLLPLNLMNEPQKIMSLLSQRQEALADNIANMQTPGYKRKDVNFSQYLNKTSLSSLENKLNEKFGASPISQSSSSDKLSAEDELSLMQENYLLYSVASRQLSSTITQIKTAMNVSANG